MRNLEYDCLVFQIGCISIKKIESNLNPPAGGQGVLGQAPINNLQIHQPTMYNVAAAANNRPILGQQQPVQIPAPAAQPVYTAPQAAPASNMSSTAGGNFAAPVAAQPAAQPAAEPAASAVASYKRFPRGSPLPQDGAGYKRFRRD